MKIVSSRRLPWTILTLLLLVGGMLPHAKADISFGYSNTVGSSIVFPGDTTFHFSPAVNNFQVTTGTAAGLLGQITGTFIIGSITTVGPVSSAPVTGTGAFIIHDGAFDLAGTLTWIDMSQIGTADTLNFSGTVNLTGITYGGTNPDLLGLANAGSGINGLTFQFVPAQTLATLRNGPGSHNTSFSGTVVSVPEPSSAIVALAGFATLALHCLRRKKNRA